MLLNQFILIDFVLLCNFSLISLIFIGMPYVTYNETVSVFHYSVPFLFCFINNTNQNCPVTMREKRLKFFANTKSCQIKLCEYVFAIPCKCG